MPPQVTRQDDDGPTLTVVGALDPTTADRALPAPTGPQLVLTWPASPWSTGSTATGRRALPRRPRARAWSGRCAPRPSPPASSATGSRRPVPSRSGRGALVAGGANGALPGLEPALQAALVLPLRARGRRLGALVRGATDARRLGDEELEAGRGPGRRGALAIDGARLPAPRRHVAETLQASLLPEALSEVDGQEGPLRDAAAVAVALVR